MINKITGFDGRDLPVLNEVLRELDDRLEKVDNTIPTAHVAADSTHSVPIVINNTTYYIMLTTVAP